MRRKATSVPLQYTDRQPVTSFHTNAADGAGSEMASLSTNREVKGNQFPSARREAGLAERSFDLAHLNCSAGLHLRLLEKRGVRPGMMTEATMDAWAEGARCAAPPVVLEARNLRKVFPSHPQELVVLSDVNLALLEGEMAAIVAPSGAGKSTLLHLLAALDRPTSGTVYFGAKPLEATDDAALARFRNSAVGFVWQRHHLLPDFSAAENVALPLLVRGERFEEALRRAHEWLAEVGLEPYASHRAGELSGGEQQRVAIARALVTEPSVLLADEPTGDLDERNAVAVFELIERLHRAHRLSSLMATHNQALAARCDRVMGLEHGVLRPVVLRGVGRPGTVS